MSRNQSFTIGLTVISKHDTIVKDALKAIRLELTDRFKGMEKELTQRVRDHVIAAISNSPEWISLKTGVLREEIGLAEDSKLGELLQIWERGVNVIAKPVRRKGSGLVGGFKIMAIQGDFEDVLGDAAATYNTEKGQVIPWLEWLLKKGDAIIIRDYSIDLTLPQYSRTGGAIMVKSTGRKSGWHVPTDFSGTIQSNFVTRAIDEVLPSIEKDIIKIIQDRI